MSYFVDPYKKYYEMLKSKTSITSECGNITSSISESSTSLSNLKTLLSSSTWKEMGIEELATATIPNLSKSVTQLQSNFENGLKKQLMMQ